MKRNLHCQRVTWGQFYRLARDLALAIHASGFRPDMIIAIERGGYMPARVLADYLDIMDVASVKIEHYLGAKRQSEARIRYPLPVSIDLQDKLVLLVDDVSDSGDTFQLALEHIHQCGQPRALKSAVLHHKVVSSHVPDFHARRIIKWRWLVYPWAIIEDLSTMVSAMQPPPRSLDEIKQRLESEYSLVVPERTLQDVITLKS